MTKTTKTLPEIYREAAELVLAEGKVENEMKSIGDDDQCFGYCTMGAVFEVTGNLNEFGEVLEEFDGTDEETRLIEPVADQLDASGRYKKVRYSEENFSSWMTIAGWNDQEENKPTAQDVAALLRETADAVEEVSV